MEGYWELSDADNFAFQFESEEALYQWLLDLHEEIEIEDLSEMLQLFVDNELHEHYLTVKRFIANEIDKK